MITTENGYTLSERIKYREFKTSMDYLQKIIRQISFRQAREYKINVVPFMSIVKRPENRLKDGYYKKHKEKAIQIVRDAKEDIRKMFIEYDSKTKDEKKDILRISSERKQECIEDIEKITQAPYAMYITLKELDNKENRDVYRFMFEVFFGKPNESFFKIIEESRDVIYELVEVSSDESNNINQSDIIQIYDYKYIKVPVIKCKSIYKDEESPNRENIGVVDIIGGGDNSEEDIIINGNVVV